MIGDENACMALDRLLHFPEYFKYFRVITWSIMYLAAMTNAIKQKLALGRYEITL